MSWFNNDITFCMNKTCPYTKCMRYYTNAPTAHPFSMALFFPQPDGSCDERFDTDWESVEVRLIGERDE